MDASVVDMQIPAGRYKGQWAMDFKACQVLASTREVAHRLPEDVDWTVSRADGPQNAASNPENYRLFAVGLYLSAFDWSRGIAMTPEAAGEIDRWWATNGTRYGSISSSKTPFGLVIHVPTQACLLGACKGMNLLSGDGLYDSLIPEAALTLAFQGHLQHHHPAPP